MKRYPLFILLTVLLSSSCSGSKEPGGLNLTKTDDLHDKRIAILVGSICDSYVKEHYPHSKMLYIDNISDIVLAVKNGQCDGTFFDQGIIPDVVKEHPEIGVLEEGLIYQDIGFGFNRNNTQLKDLFNEFLRELKDSGQLEVLLDSWINEYENMPVPVVGGDGSGGVVRMGTTGTEIPGSFVKDGKPTGLDIDLLYRFATKHNLKVEVQRLLFGGLIAAIETGKVDIIGSGIAITEERSKRIDFSEPYQKIRIDAIALKKNIAAGNHASNKFNNASDLADKRLGVLIGSVYDRYATEHYPNAKLVYIDNMPDIVVAIENNKCDGAFFANDVIADILRQHPAIGVLETGLFSHEMGFGFNYNNPRLRELFNDFLRELRAAGELQAIYDRWVNDFDTTPLPVLGGDGSGGVIRFVTTGSDVPSSAIRDGQPAGYDIDLFYRFATKHNFKVEIQRIHFGGLIAAISSGKADIAGSSIIITEERAKQMAFSEPYASKRIDALALKKNIAAYATEENTADQPSFLTTFVQNFDNNLIREKRYMLIVNGLMVTLLISVLSALLGTILGGLICFMRMSSNRLCRSIAAGYIIVLRGTPILVLLMILFYIVFAKVDINAVVVAVIAFAMNLAAYVSEMFRTSIESVNKGQTEAGIAMGFTKVSTFIHIILPQAVHRVMPVYKGEFISLVKMTSVVGYIAVEDLTKASDIIRSRTFDAFFPLLLVAAIYFLLAWLCTLLLDRIELSVDPKHILKKQIKTTLKDSK
ncbi:MAG: ABC transporter permease subunit [Tannerellaceae bacterium]|jgi:polar amino acid transport system substrate-binding protein|nr:ABC transporter permease subunit [Tannerellaceae bacterium]